jgi:L-fuconolactonase
MMLDAHQHFWRLARGDYRFPAADDAVLYHDFMPEDLRPTLDTLGIERTVLVQATDTIDESRFLLDLASRTPFVAGVVGWWDAATPRLLEKLLAAPHADLLVGVRPMLQRFSDVAWLVQPGTLRHLRRLAAHNLVLDALVDTRHLPTLRMLCTRLPELKVVIDHMAKPWRLPERYDVWDAEMERLGAQPNCWVKLSGFPFGEPGGGLGPTLEQLIARLRRWFPLERLVWGSDWPVVRREGGYALALQAVRARFTDAEATLVMSDNGAQLYGLSRR